MKLSASRVGLLAHCQAWAQDDAEWSQTGSHAAMVGAAIHARAAQYITNGSFSLAHDLDESAKARWHHLLTWLTDAKREAECGANGWEAEVAFAWDPDTDTATHLGNNIGRNYPRDGRLCGAADIVSVTDDGVVIVWDIKTGHSVDGVWPQMGALGLLAARAYGKTSVSLRVVHVTDDGVTVHERTMESFSLAAMAGTLGGNIENIASARPQPGTHCASMYCPHVSHCSATASAVEQLIPTDGLVRTKVLSAAIVDQEHAASVYVKLRAIEAAAEVVWGRLKEYGAANDGVLLGNGKKYAQCPTRGRNSIDAKALEDLARRLGASSEQVAACYRDGKPGQSWREVKA